MPNMNPGKESERLIASILTLVSMILSVLCLRDEVSGSVVLATLYCVIPVLAVSGFTMFLLTRVSQQSFWLGTYLTLSLVTFGVVLLFTGVTYTGSVVFDLGVAMLRSYWLGLPFAMGITQLLGWVYYQTNS